MFAQNRNLYIFICEDRDFKKEGAGLLWVVASLEKNVEIRVTSVRLEGKRVTRNERMVEGSWDYAATFAETSRRRVAWAFVQEERKRKRESERSR